MLTPFPRPDGNLAEDWTFVVFLICLSLLAWQQISEPGQLRRHLHNAFNIRLMRQEMREESQRRRTRFVYQLNFLLLSGLILYFAITGFTDARFPVGGILLYLLLVGTIALLYAVRYIQINAVMTLLNGDFTLSEYRYSLFLLIRIGGNLLLPITLLAAYLSFETSGILVITGLSVLLLLLVYRWFRGLINALRVGLSAYYIFFYICTLEILPLLLGAKALGVVEWVN
jgi:hypothetical protein